MNKTGITKVTAGAPKNVLYCVEPKITVGVILSAAGFTAGTDGVMLAKAGTPITGDLCNRDTAFTLSDGETATAVLLHDTTFAFGETTANATAAVFGAIDAVKLDADVLTMYTDKVKSGLPGIYLIKS